MNKFTIFYKSGGGDTIKIVDKYWKMLTKIVDELSQHDYSKGIDQFHVMLRVDGDYLSFGDPEGCNTLCLFKKKKLIANSISFGKNIYSDEEILSNFLKKNIVLCFEEIINKLKQNKIDIQEKKLLNDLDEYINEIWNCMSD